MVETKDPEDAAEVEQQFYEHMTQNFPNIITRSALLLCLRCLKLLLRSVLSVKTPIH